MKFQETLNQIKEILHQIEGTLTEDPYFELGDAPDVLNYLLDALDEIDDLLHQNVGPHYSLEKVGLSKANLYYETLQSVENTKKFVSEVQRQARGSQKNTEQAKLHLDHCFELFTRLADFEPITEGLITPPIELPRPIERCWAIIVGVTSHQDVDEYGRLPYAAEDAGRLARLLLSGPRGYARERLLLFADEPAKIVNAPDPNGPPAWKLIIKGIEHFADLVQPDDLLLFYFSGHGILWKGQPYLVAKNTESNYVERTGILMTSEVKKKILASQAGPKLSSLILATPVL